MELKSDVRKAVEKSILNGEKLIIGEDDSFLENGILDSFKLMELVRTIEKKYDIIFDDDDLTPENLDSINAITNFLTSKMEN